MKPKYENKSLILDRNLYDIYNLDKKYFGLFEKYVDPQVTFQGLFSSDLIKFFSHEAISEVYYKFPLTDEDRKIYEDYYAIVDTPSFYQVHHVKGCNQIMRSSFCFDSSAVFDSLDVYDSYFIVQSKTVLESSWIHKSNRIEGSHWISEGKEITNSSYSIKGDLVLDSFYIFESKEIESSAYLFQCQNLKNSALCSSLNNSTHKIFCTELDDHPLPEGPAIFNEEISLRTFNLIYDEIMGVVKSREKDYGINKEVGFQQMITVPSPFYAYTTELEDEKLAAFIRSLLPKYDPSLAYKITYSKLFL